MFMKRGAITLLAVSFALSGASAQEYFGQNKVRYEKYDFKILKTPHFDIYFYGKEAPAIDDAGRMAERWYTRLSQLFDWKLSSRQPVIFYANPADFRSTTVIPGMIGEATGGVTEPLRRRVILPFGTSLAETDHVLGHELVHAFQYDMRPKNAGLGAGNALEQLPLWFIEGMAEYFSIGPEDAQTAMWMRDAVRRGQVPSLKQLSNPKYFPYRYGEAFWAYIGGRYGDDKIGKIMRAGAHSGDALAAISSVLGVSADRVSTEWKQALDTRNKPILQATNPPNQNGRVLVPSKEGTGELNVSPAMSPDGKYMTFLSERSLVSIDLYLADARTGQIRRRLTKTATDPHFNSLEFTHSTGSWSADSRLFAYAHSEKSKPLITVYDVQKDSDVRTLRFPDLGEITGITWSPDSSQIAFSAMHGGTSDLYMADVKTGATKQLTNDAYADVQPAWSPDGKSIAFVSDRFDTDLNDLSIGQYGLALLDLANGAISQVKTFNEGRQIDPQWGPEGRSIYFVSDRSGIPNIYRISLVDRALTQITNVQTGVAGITASSPAIAVAREVRELAYSAFTGGGYEIISLNPQQAAGNPPGPVRIAGEDAALLPPRKQPGGEVFAMLQSPQRGLLAASQFHMTDYEPHLSLDYVAPPSVGIGVGSFGTLIGGGTALHFSDMLDYNSLVVTFQTFSSDSSNFLRDLTAGATYLNQRSRWNWGFTGAQIPYVSGFFTQGFVTNGGQTAFAQQQVTVWQIERQLAGILEYPFSRAMRIEFSGGYENVDFAAQSETSFFDPVTGVFLGGTREDAPAPSSLNMAVGNSALVYDTSVFGGTSPVMGQRYRLQAGGSSGSLTFSTLLADYRRYIHLSRSLSLAGRFLTYGRYGGDAESDRLQPLYVGYNSLVRGYDPGSFSAKDCGPALQQTGACPAFDQLLGSHIAVGNAEFRVELLGPLGAVPSRHFIPVEAAPFVDTGKAWGRVTGIPEIPRPWISSYGTCLRINLLGMAVAEISLVHADDRPARSWMWQFSLLPGF